VCVYVRACVYVRVWVCICVCQGVCVCECVCVCVRVWVQGVGVCFFACSLTYPACKTHAQYCLRPLWLHHIYLSLSHKRHDFREKVAEHKICGLIFSTTFV
jgi:hypothetical protein